MKLLENANFWLERSPLAAISLNIGVGIALNIFCLPMYSAQAAPPEELKRLEYFEGEWTCQQPADSTEPSGEFTWNVELGLNDFWYLGNAQQTLSPADGQPINSQEFLGYDVAAGKLVRSVVVGNGNSYSLSANDWQNEKLVWQGTITMKGKSTPLKEEIVKNSSDSFTATYFVKGQKDNWLPVVNESCDRQT